MTAPFDHLERQVHALIAHCRRLRDENRELRALCQRQQRRQQELEDKLRQAGAMVEAMLERVGAFEASQHDQHTQFPGEPAKQAAVARDAGSS